jgi:dTDP-4-dehydrorhamnose reductase
MIALIGHGYVGKHIAKELQNKGLPFEWFTHKNRIPSSVTAIINAAGYTGVPNVDACEKNKQACIAGNVIYPMHLERNYPYTPIVHITSGCVYTGYRDGGWTEDDLPNFTFDNGSFYSGSKALFQSLLIPNYKSYLLRIRLPFGDEDNPKNYLTKLKNYEKLVDFENSVSYVNDVAAVAVHFAKNLPKPGIYNVCNPGTITTRQVADMMGLQKQWFTEEQFGDAVVAPRSNCNMSSEKLQNVFPIQSATDALAVAIKNMQNA